MNCRAVELTEMPRAFSISIQSDTVERRPDLPWTAPASVITRACSARASVSVDLPASGWAMTANVRRRATSEATSPDPSVPGCRPFVPAFSAVSVTHPPRARAALAAAGPVYVRAVGAAQSGQLASSGGRHRPVAASCVTTNDSQPRSG